MKIKADNSIQTSIARQVASGGLETSVEVRGYSRYRNEKSVAGTEGVVDTLEVKRCKYGIKKRAYPQRFNTPGTVASADAFLVRAFSQIRVKP
ncbi:hypothetical protein ACPOL_1942 [Acidisarcina polymorpha]|uniref:Uncharacterized protein n=1 Tax=Acidisarcina polymorpha TaxID=2211140 RepID=A0A2Z5FWN2_9BACT|nr:hypothetical protein [Acidisarcina polymorpha]AXC11278.1 hypothetical protein ACPOL_1942 [Acidisarcina polymorpha]